MTLRLQNLMLAMLLALTTLFVGFGTLSQNPASGGYQLFERAASGISADIPLAALGNFDYFAKIAPECCNAPNSVPIKPLVDPSTNVASAQRTQHILHGDATGGGHLWPDSAGKTPFPQSWDANKIMSTTSDLATNPNFLWQPQTGSGGLYTKSGKPARFVVTDANGNLPVVDGVPVRVIIEPAGEGIITAYPKY
jgi:hypothetical protein